MGFFEDNEPKNNEGYYQGRVEQIEREKDEQEEKEKREKEERYFKAGYVKKITQGGWITFGIGVVLSITLYGAIIGIPLMLFALSMKEWRKPDGSKAIDIQEDKKQEKDEKYCSECGEKIKRNSKYCSGCGHNQ